MLMSLRDNTTKPLKPLFTIDAEYDEFKARHEKARVNKKPLSEHEGDCFIGIDAGSTTTKLVVTDRDNNLLYSLYYYLPINHTSLIPYGIVYHFVEYSIINFCVQ